MSRARIARLHGFGSVSEVLALRATPVVDSQGPGPYP